MNDPFEDCIGCSVVFVAVWALIMISSFMIYLAITWLRWICFWLGYSFPI